MSLYTSRKLYFNKYLLLNTYYFAFSEIIIPVQDIPNLCVALIIPSPAVKPILVRIIFINIL